MFSQLFRIAALKYNLEDNIKETLEKAEHVNDVWADTYKRNVKYLQNFYKGNNDHITILLDEVDKSLDINNVEYMFTELIPKLHDINNDQIIVISHSPLVLSEDVCNSEKYNLISLMPEYTQKVKELFRNIKF